MESAQYEESNIETTEDNNVETEQEETTLAEQLDEASNVDEVDSTVEQPEERPVKVSNKELNFQKLRDEKAKAEKERDELLAYLRKNQPQDPQHKQYQEDVEEEEVALAADDLVEGRHYTSVNKKIKKLNEQLVETRIRAQYPDFEQVVNPDNLQTLKELYPELSNTIGSSKNLHNQAVSAYTLIKKLGIHVEDTHEKEREIVRRNAAKPKPVSTVSPQQGNSPLSHANAFANGLTPELKAQLYAEMQAARKNY